MGSGFSERRLAQVDGYLQRLVDTSAVAGVGARIIRHGVDAYYKSFGWQNIEHRIPMHNDSLYRIFSMTKTFTIVTAMTLYEKGLFKLHDPIAEFLPAFAHAVVAQTDERGIIQFVPAKRPITFEHLCTMTSGIPYPGTDSYSARFFAEGSRRIKEDAFQGKAWTTADIVDECAKVPLCFHPGDYWLYGFSHDVLGRLIEVISGMPFSSYMTEAVLKPLQLHDTGFFVPQEKQKRVATVYEATDRGLIEKDDFDTDAARPVPPSFESGGGGLISTLADVGTFGSMLLNEGTYQGERILSRKTVELIRRNHVLPSQRPAQFSFSSQGGYGYGLGVRTMLDTSMAGLNGSDGEWAWDGMLGTWYCIDPTEDMVAVFLVQRYPGANEDLPKRFAQTVYGAIDD
ncbi:MAG: beta-lactamase family protein [Treponema sp.]|jgi:CubicO group peptidase (beta-lactamase class C family)|nr:beta-lactamase family protein [Treponema sp.]